LAGFINEIERRFVVPADPVDLRAAVQEILGRSSLATVACIPERHGDHVPIRARFVSEDSLHSIQQPESSGIAQPRTGTSFDESPGRRPVAKPTCIGERAAAAEHSALGLDVSSRIEQRIEYGNVITARGPVQRRFGVRAELAVGVHISSGRDQTFRHRRTIWKVPRPVGGRMQQRPVAVPIANARRRKPWICSEHPLERWEVACLYGLGRRNSTWIVC
jgi:hypothetical protein